MRRPEILAERLSLVFEWLEGMVDSRSGHLIHLYEPETGEIVVDGSAIRDIASIWDAEVLGDFLGRDELRPLIERSLDRFSGMLVDRDGYSVVRPPLETPSIAHNAVMLLALARSHRSEDRGGIPPLAEAILRQQRRNGSYQIFFVNEPDSGEELYPGEAMLALLEAFRIHRDARFVESVERAMRYYRLRYYEQGWVDPGLLVFFANWLSQAGSRLFRLTSKDEVRRFVADFLFEAHDRVVESGFYDDIAIHPRAQACVEVACALEGIADAYTVAAALNDSQRLVTYRHCARTALVFLLAAQRTSGAEPRERGGFGYSLTDRTQRIDVTGHAASGFIKCVQSGIARGEEAAPSAEPSPWQPG